MTTTKKRTLPRSAGMYDPWLHAAHLGVRIIVEPFAAEALDGARHEILGYYEDAERTVYLRAGVGQNQLRAVLAHELQHAVGRHRSTRSEGYHQRREVAVDRRAALACMPEDEWRQALDACHGLPEDALVRALASSFRVDLHTVGVRRAMDR